MSILPRLAMLHGLQTADKTAACILLLSPPNSLLPTAPLPRPQPAPLPLPSRLQPDPGQFFNRPPRAKKQQQPQQRKPADPGSGRSGSGSGARPGATSGSSPGASSGGSSGSGTGRLRPGHGAGGPAGQFKRVLGGLLPLAAGGHLSCPALIVKMRAAIAALKPVRDLRPQALPIRCEGLGVGTCGWQLWQCSGRGAMSAPGLRPDAFDSIHKGHVPSDVLGHHFSSPAAPAPAAAPPAERWP